MAEKRIIELVFWVKYSSLNTWQVQPKRCSMMSDREGNDWVYIWENKDVCNIQTVKICFDDWQNVLH